MTCTARRVAGWHWAAGWAGPDVQATTWTTHAGWPACMRPCCARPPAPMTWPAGWMDLDPPSFGYGRIWCWPRRCGSHGRPGSRSSPPRTGPPRSDRPDVTNPPPAGADRPTGRWTVRIRPGRRHAIAAHGILRRPSEDVVVAKNAVRPAQGPGRGCGARDLPGQFVTC